MKNRIPLLLVVSALLIALVGCGKNDGKGGKDGKDGKDGKKDAAKITLETVKNAKMGFAIDIPKGSKTLAKSDMGHTFSLALPGGLFEYNTHLMPLGAASLAQFARSATMMGQKKIEEKKAIPGGFLVVKAPQGALQEVWVTKKGKTAKITVKCSGPKKGKALLVKICTSLKVTK